MALKIVYAKEAIDSIAEVVAYLETEWSDKIAEKFIQNLNDHIHLLASGIVQGKAAYIQGVYSILITKHNRLYYSKGVDCIQLLLLWDTRQNPTRHPFE